MNLAPSDPPPKKLVLSATIPKEFHFSTNSRVKADSSTASDQVDFKANLRKHPSSPVRGVGLRPWRQARIGAVVMAFALCFSFLNLCFSLLKAKGPKGATVPKPFNLSTGNKRKGEDTGDAYVPIAEQIAQFQRRTPDRYHLRSRQEQERGECG